MKSRLSVQGRASVRGEEVREEVREGIARLEGARDEQGGRGGSTAQDGYGCGGSTRATYHR